MTARNGTAGPRIRMRTNLGDGGHRVDRAPCDCRRAGSSVL
jgi:hypothetical protein